MIVDLIDAFFGSCAANFWLRTCAEAFGHCRTELNQTFSLGLRQRLRIGIGHNKFNTAQTGIDHVIDRIATATANTEYGDPGLKLGNIRLLQIDTHLFRSFSSLPPRRCGIFLGFPD